MSKPALARYWSDSENAGRGYIRPSNGEQVPGVTSITGKVDKDLAQWGADQAVRWMVANWFRWNPGAKSEDSAFRGARYRWKDYRNERGAIGTGVHNHIEGLIENSGPFLDDLDQEQREMVEQYEEFVFTHAPQFISSEVSVFGDGYAGTLDAYAIIDGDVWLLDWKTSKRCYPEYFMQLAALKNAHTVAIPTTADDPDAFEVLDTDRKPMYYREEPVLNADRAGLVHLRGNFWDGETFIPAKWELIELPQEDEQLHMARFNAYKDVWYAEKSLRQSGVDLKAALDKKGGQ